MTSQQFWKCKVKGADQLMSLLTPQGDAFYRTMGFPKTGWLTWANPISFYALFPLYPFSLIMRQLTHSSNLVVFPSGIWGPIKKLFVPMVFSLTKQSKLLCPPQALPHYTIVLGQTGHQLQSTQAFWTPYPTPPPGCGFFLFSMKHLPFPYSADLGFKKSKYCLPQISFLATSCFLS